ncbi:hypothetical protein [Oculatella sp. LEGE 06141]|uniref:hypothetical protein n=1 Tax=Oculatella sp. LEGE 06141 TaxID=1828648 RepID=UPI0030D8818B
MFAILARNILQVNDCFSKTITHVTAKAPMGTSQSSAPIVVVLPGASEVEASLGFSVSMV